MRFQTLFTIGVFAIFASANADDKTETVSLFDGKSMAGWVTADGKPAPEGWTARDGEIVRQAKAGHIYFHREFENFELTFDWKIAKNGNSGIKYRVRKYDGALLGCEYQVFDDRGRPFSKSSAGSIYALYEPNEKKKANPPGEWNSGKIVVDGNRLEHWLNGEQIVAADTRSEEWKKRHQSSKFNKHADFAQNAVGKIMLQDHGSEVAFRNLVLRTLPPTPRPTRPEKPNIIFVMVDDLGPEWVSCYGAEGIETPAIDALAATGMRFDNAYSMPKCTPTRATLLTGQYPFRHGWVNHWDVPRWGAGCHFDPKHNTTFASLLKKAGYTTCIAGKWQINDFRVQPNVLEQHGFDEWCMWTGYETGNPPSAERYWNPYVHTRDGSKTYKDRFGADVFADFIIDFLKQNHEKPMMVYFPMALTHGPLVPTPAERDAEEKYDRHRAMVRYTDFTMGRIVKALDELKIRERTIIVFTTDNGTSGGITGVLNGRTVKGGKGSIGENGCREPYIVNCPGTVPVATTDCLTDFTDLLPTFCELGGAEVPADLKIDGHSIANVFLGEAKDGPRQWIMAMGGGVARMTDKGRVVPAKPFASRGIRDKRFKLWIDDQGQTIKVFDLAKDPGEENNLLDSNDKQVNAARKQLEAVVASFPKVDGVPRYDPTPSQTWDRKSTPDSGKKPKRANRKKNKAKQGAK